MRQNTCCFTGHHVQALPWGTQEADPRCAAMKERLREMVVWLIEEKGVDCFISGMAQGVDTYAAELVLSLRREGRPITLECVIPFPDQAGHWPPEAQQRYQNIRQAADRETVVQDGYTSSCYQHWNQYMMDQSGFLLAVWDGRSGGGTAATVRYARWRGNVSILLCPP